jgi:hypothetical protein
VIEARAPSLRRAGAAVLGPPAALGLLAWLGLTSCEALAPRIVPVQSARVVTAESFRQTFTVENVPRAERVFRSVLGPENYAALPPDEWVPYVEKLTQGSVEAIGTGTFVVSLMPQNHAQFFFEGWGHYSVLDTVAKQILVSGEFLAIDDGAHSTRELERGYFDTRVRQTLVRHFAPHRPSFVHESVLALRVHVKRIDADLYILDYGAGHEVGIPDAAGRVEKTGCVAFDHKRDGRKLIDLRGVALLRDDYGDKLAAAGFEPERLGAELDWGELSACSPGEEAARRAASCACPRVDGEVAASRAAAKMEQQP